MTRLLRIGRNYLSTRDDDKVTVLESSDDIKMKERGFVVKIHRQKRGTLIKMLLTIDQFQYETPQKLNKYLFISITDQKFNQMTNLSEDGARQ